jgi:hypothetical protein
MKRLIRKILREQYHKSDRHYRRLDVISIDKKLMNL